MRICFLCSEYPPALHGGIGSVTRIIARALVQRGHSAWVIGGCHGMNRLPVYEEDEGVRVWRLAVSGQRTDWMRLRYRIWNQVSRWAVNGEIDLVEAPDYAGMTALWPSLPVPVVARLHGSITYFASEMDKPVKSATRWIEKQSLHRAEYWCSCSAYTLEKTKLVFQIEPKTTRIIHNFVEASSSRAQAGRHGDLVVFSGTLVRKKGVIPLMHAWNRVHARYPSARLHLYGKDALTEAADSMRAYLISLLEPSARRSVHFHGHAPREVLFGALEKASVAVFPSYAEAFSMAPLEAMAHGCPTIYSKRGSGPELITHSQDGLLVDPDHPEDIAEAILHLLIRPERARQIADKGLERIERDFSLRALMPRNEAFFQDCIAGHAASGGKGGERIQDWKTNAA